MSDLPELSYGERLRICLVMSFSTTQKAVLNRMGYMPGAGFKSPEKQELDARQIDARLAAAERGDPWPQDRWILDRVGENDGDRK